MRAKEFWMTKLFRRADARRLGGPVKPGHDTVFIPSPGVGIGFAA
jgi:hypothetical protein